jgi:hypothetical protein
VPEVSSEYLATLRRMCELTASKKIQSVKTLEIIRRILR